MTNWCKDLKEKKYCVRKNISSQPLCEWCKEPLSYIGNGKGYQRFCSKSCASFFKNQNIDQTKKVLKMKETCLEKYGEDNFWKTEEFKKLKQNSNAEWESKRIQNLQRTLINKFGGVSPFCSKEVKQKSENTLFEKYGVHSYFDTNEFKTRVISTETKILAYQNMIKTIRAKYKSPNATSPWSLKFVQDKMQSTRKTLYGTAWPMQNYVSFMKNRASCYALKEVIDNDGNMHLLQGYEPQVFKFLSEQGKKLSSDCSLLPELYLENGSRYYPDLFDLENKIVYEVKSQYTYSRAIEKLKMCRKAVEKKGFTYIVLVWENGFIEEK